jgi:hypothetical protein
MPYNRDHVIGRVAQLVRAPASHAGGPGFESLRAHHTFLLESICPPFRKRKLTTAVHKSVQKMVQLTFAVPEIPRSLA